MAKHSTILTLIFGIALGVACGSRIKKLTVADDDLPSSVTDNHIKESTGQSPTDLNAIHDETHKEIQESTKDSMIQRLSAELAREKAKNAKLNEENAKLNDKLDDCVRDAWRYVHSIQERGRQASKTLEREEFAIGEHGRLNVGDRVEIMGAGKHNGKVGVVVSFDMDGDPYVNFNDGTGLYNDYRGRFKLVTHSLNKQDADVSAEVVAADVPSAWKERFMQHQPKHLEEGTESANMVEEWWDNQSVPLGNSEPDHEKRCIGTSVSRRRRHGDMCTCRRRISGRAEGLQPGWTCGDDDKIVFEGIDDAQKVCCCKPKACTPEALRRGDARELPDQTGNKKKCCKVMTKGVFGVCPMNSGYGERESIQACTKPKVSPSIHNCKIAITTWLKNKDWYEVLDDWERNQDVYADYIPCMQTRDEHVRIMLDKQSSLKRVIHADETENPMHRFIEQRPGCTGLLMVDLISAVDASYYEICPFGIPGDASNPYKPNFNPDRTCAFHAENRSIVLRPQASCPEGHRCACSIFDETQVLKLAVGTSVSSYQYAYSGVMAVSYGALMVAGATAAIPAAFAIGIGVGVAAVSFGARYVWDTMTHTCKTNIGCRPMDCVYVSQLGCRIRPAETLDDTRNPFWFMPPPTYKCHMRTTGCQLHQCSRRNLIDTRIGLYNSSLFRSGFSGVYNCQPILYKHMSKRQRTEFERILDPLTRETQAHLDRTKALAEKLEHVCAWMWPTKRTRSAKCNDGTFCTMSRHVKKKLGWKCCTDHGGVQRCPRRYPIMCNNGDCDSQENSCRKKDGVKKCPAWAQCPWLAPTNAPGVSECENDEECTESRGGMWSRHKTCCAERGGVRRCPPEKPIMCARRACNGGFCCVGITKHCEDMGGPRICNLTESSLNLPMLTNASTSSSSTSTSTSSIGSSLSSSSYGADMQLGAGIDEASHREYGVNQQHDQESLQVNSFAEQVDLQADGGSANARGHEHQKQH